MPNFGPFEGERPAPTTRPQANGDDDRNDNGEPVSAIGSDVSDLRG